MSTNDEKISKLFSEVNQLIQDQKYDEVIEKCDSILKIIQDPVAYEIKITALIHNGEFDKALKIAEEKKISISPYSHAYCLYRTEKLSDALKVLENSKTQNTAY